MTSLADSVVVQGLESDDLTVLPILLNSEFETMCTASTFFENYNYNLHLISIRSNLAEEMGTL